MLHVTREGRTLLIVTYVSDGYNAVGVLPWADKASPMTLTHIARDFRYQTHHEVYIYKIR